MNLSTNIAGTLANEPAGDQASRLRSLVRALRDKDADAPATVSPQPAHQPPSPALESTRTPKGHEGPAASRPRAHVIAIASGKGGVGKSVLAVNLALCLARTGARVLLLDADLGAANDDILLNLRPTRRMSTAFSAPLASLAIDAGHGLRLIPGPVGVRAPSAIPDELWHRLHELDDLTDTIVVDLPAGIDPFIVETGAQADALLLVTTPEPPAVADAYALLKGVTARRGEGLCTPLQRIELVVNQTRDDAQGVFVHERMALVALRFLARRLPLAGVVPLDPGVPRSVASRQPLVIHEPSTPAAGAIAAIAGRISDASSAFARARISPSSGI